MLDFLAANWLWIAIGAGFVWLHTRGGGCGMHGSHGSHGSHQQHDQEHRGGHADGPTRGGAEGRSLDRSDPERV